jgi:23S rRNA (guanosine2251-2'-O)-methyltransferase
MSKRKTGRAPGKAPAKGSGKGAGKPAAPPEARGKAAKGGHAIWLYGAHAVLAALANPNRRCERLVVADDQAAGYEETLAPLLRGRADLAKGRETMGRADLERLIGRGAVHQGLALLATPAAQPELMDLLDRLERDAPACIVLLDQVSDPQNVGAVLRSAAAFGATAVVTTERNAPHETGALAKAASGGLEAVPFIHVTNLARGLDELAEAGFRLLGFAGDAEATLDVEADNRRTAIVLGAEGAGLRRLTRERCDRLVRLPTVSRLTDLNVSNAAAVALYELHGRKLAGST